MTVIRGLKIFWLQNIESSSNLLSILERGFKLLWLWSYNNCPPQHLLIFDAYLRGGSRYVISMKYWNPFLVLILIIEPHSHSSFMHTYTINRPIWNSFFFGGGGGKWCQKRSHNIYWDYKVEVGSYISRLLYCETNSPIASGSRRGFNISQP